MADSLLGILVQVACHNVLGLEMQIAPGFQSFYSEINYYYEGFSFKWNLHFSLSAFNTLYLLYILSVLTMLFHVDFFWSCLFCVLCASWICMDMFFLSLGKFSSIDVVKDFVYPGDLWFFLSSIFISILAFSCCLTFPVCSLLYY